MKKMSFKYVVAILILIFVSTVALYFTRIHTIDKEDERKQEIITIFKENTEVFKKVAYFIWSREEEYYSVTTPYTNPNDIVVQTKVNNKYKKLEVSEYRAIQTELNIIMYKYDFSGVYKRDNEIVFKKGIWSQAEQGIIFPLTEEGPTAHFTEEIGDNWYYYLVVMD